MWIGDKCQEVIEERGLPDREADVSVCNMRRGRLPYPWRFFFLPLLQCMHLCYGTVSLLVGNGDMDMHKISVCVCVTFLF